MKATVTLWLLNEVAIYGPFRILATSFQIIHVFTLVSLIRLAG